MGARSEFNYTTQLLMVYCGRYGFDVALAAS